jgi:cysteine desulfurase
MLSLVRTGLDSVARMELTYLDHAATTPMRTAAIEAMVPFFADRFANPSGSHRFARDARRAIDEARDEVASALGVDPGEVVFTSGGTEADNTAIFGAGGPVVCGAAEHHAVLHAVQKAGGAVIATDCTGHIDLEALEAALSAETRLVSVMAVNNEVGTITDLAAVSRLVRRLAPDAILHTDAVQAICWLDIRSISPLVDAMSFSAHKFGGPKGVGVLTVRDGVSLDPILVGGGQERDRRSGTHNVAGIVAMATAMAETDRERDDEIRRMTLLRDRLVDGLASNVDGVTETVERDKKIAGSAHVCIGGIESESLLFLLDEAGVCASAASACASGAMEPSHVLAAMGVDDQVGALRLSLGHTTTEAEIGRAIDVIVDSVGRLRRLSASGST